MTPDQIIESLEYFLSEAKRIKNEGPNDNSDFPSLLNDIEDTFRFVEVEE